MVCKKVSYTNFRNIERQTVFFADGLNVIEGKNAQGKTNAIEGIWVCSSGKSHRAVKDSEMIAFERNETNVYTEYTDSGNDKSVEVIISSNGQKKCKADGFFVKKRSEFIGKFKSVIFTPEHLSIVKNGPGERRNFLDNALCLLYPSYTANIQDYTRILKQRNKMLSDHAEEKINLKESRELFDELEIWTEKLAEKSEKIAIERLEYSKKIKEVSGNIFNDMTDGKEKLDIVYSDIKTKEGYLKDLRDHYEKEFIVGTTLVGIHKDDLRITINGKETKNYGSQGQQRSVALSMKISEGEIIRNVTGEYPVFLFDDILSELDEKRQNYILSGLDNKQVILTVCNTIKNQTGNRIICENGNYYQ